MINFTTTDASIANFNEINKRVSEISARIRKTATLKQNELLARAMVEHNDFDPTHYSMKTYSDIVDIRNGARCDCYCKVEY